MNILELSLKWTLTWLFDFRLHLVSGLHYITILYGSCWNIIQQPLHSLGRCKAYDAQHVSMYRNFECWLRILDTPRISPLQNTHGWHRLLLHNKCILSELFNRSIYDCVYGITNLFLNFNGCTVEVWEWISNSIPHFIVGVIPYPWWDWS